MASAKRGNMSSTLPDNPLTEGEVSRIRKDFPVLQQRFDGKPLIYLDNAATTQKPRAVIERLSRFYAEENANVHRGVHRLSEAATEAFEGTRKKIQRFLNARLDCEVILTSGATESINLVAQSYGRSQIGKGDEVLATVMEHHSNIVPWQMLCEEKGAKFRAVPINENGELEVDAYENMLSQRTKLVSIAHVSNTLGTVNPIKRLAETAHAYGAKVLVDGAQSAVHMPIDVQALGCDFFVCSAHKMVGPTGVGVLYGRAEILDAMPPYQSGGDMILAVTLDKSTFSGLPHKFEAGTPNIAGVIAFGATIDYLDAVGMERVKAYEQELTAYGMAMLYAKKGLRIIGTANDKTSILSFYMDAAHPHDIGQILDEEGVAVRAGHLCTQPLMERFDVSATARASMAFYNTKEELDVLAKALEQVKRIFA